MKFYRFLPFVLFAIFISTKLSAQKKDVFLQEEELVKTYSKMFSFVQQNYDSTLFYSKAFTNRLLHLISSNPETLSYPFKKLRESNFCEVKTSRDGKLRVYSWDKWTGRTMHEYGTIFQWKSNSKVFMKVPALLDNDPGTFCSELFTVDVNRKPIYLLVTNGTISNKDASQSISVYRITDNKLVGTVRLFKTKTERLNRIDVDYDFFSVVDRPERPIQLIRYNNKTKVIFIPVVDEKGKVMNRNLHYQLKGKYFEFIGIESL